MSCSDLVTAVEKVSSEIFCAVLLEIRERISIISGEFGGRETDQETVIAVLVIVSSEVVSGSAEENVHSSSTTALG